MGHAGSAASEFRSVQFSGLKFGEDVLEICVMNYYMYVWYVCMLLLPPPSLLLPPHVRTIRAIGAGNAEPGVTTIHAHAGTT